MQPSHIRSVLLTALALALLLPAPALAKSTVICDGPMTGSQPSIEVSAGATCTLTDATVDGSVRVGPGAVLLARDSVIAHNVDGEEGAALDLRNTQVGGNVRSTDGLSVLIGAVDGGTSRVDGHVKVKGATLQTGVSVLICGTTIGKHVEVSDSVGVGIGGASGGAACTSLGGGNVIDKHVKVRDNAPNFFRVADNVVGGHLEITGTTGSAVKRIWDNRVDGHLTCTGNDTPLHVQGNTAKTAKGQCDVPPPTAPGSAS